MGFVKIHDSIFGSSLIEQNPRTVLFFMLFCASANRDGIVDMNRAALARKFKMKRKHVDVAIETLESPDDQSRTPMENGRRIIPLDEHRDWGWSIVNYTLYREAPDENARREYQRKWVANSRARRAGKEEPYPDLVTSRVDNRLSTVDRKKSTVDGNLSTRNRRKSTVDDRSPMQMQMQKQREDARARAKACRSLAPQSLGCGFASGGEELGLDGAEVALLEKLTTGPVDEIRPSLKRSPLDTDEGAMRLERVHLMAWLFCMPYESTDERTNEQLWIEWRTKARKKTFPALADTVSADSPKTKADQDWLREVKIIRELGKRPEDVREAIELGSERGWKTFQWQWVDARNKGGKTT